jgi:cytoskeletal protein RodZ
MATDVQKSQSSPGGEQPIRELPTAPTTGSEDRCTSCGAPLAHDQRYCVECGERRGQSRFPTASPPAAVQARQASPPPPRRRPTISSGTTLVAGVGVLLLAIGLGWLIGHNNNNNTNTSRANAPAQVITVQGGSGGTATTTPTTTTAAPQSKKAKAKAKAAATAKAKPSAAVQQKATQAAGKVLGNAKNLAPPTVTNGQSCSSSQAGCSGGKFNGNFFGQ